jgi:hypothetical protein
LLVRSHSHSCGAVFTPPDEPGSSQSSPVYNQAPALPSTNLGWVSRGGYNQSSIQPLILFLRHSKNNAQYSTLTLVKDNAATCSLLRVSAIPADSGAAPTMYLREDGVEAEVSHRNGLCLAFFAFSPDLPLTPITPSPHCGTSSSRTSRDRPSLSTRPARASASSSRSDPCNKARASTSPS